MRNTTGYDVILKAIENLVLPHKDHFAAYGEGNERRLTGGSVRVGHDHPEKKEKSERDGYKFEFDTRT
ncbi:hypothetical protein AAG906_008027 [Vitis piasezkii]